MGMNGESSDLSSIFRPSQGLCPADRDDGRCCSDSESIPRSSYIWVPVCTTRLPPSTSTRLELECIAIKVILQPEYLSPVVSRADVIFDSTLTGGQIAPSATEIGFVGEFFGYNLSRQLVIRTIPRNPKRDQAIEQSIWVFEKISGPGGNGKAACEPFLIVLVPHFSTSSSDGPFYLPNARAIAIQVAGSVLTIHCLDWKRGTELGSKTEGVGCSTFGIDHDGSNCGAADVDSDRRQRMLNKLMGVLKKRFEHPEYIKRVHHDTVISRERYQSVYQDLKARHADRLCRVFASNGYDGKGCREVDKIFEELGIASFCICLWENMYSHLGNGEPDEPVMGESQTGSRAQEGRPPFVGFVDLGCGSGVLTDVLLQEGWPGYGIDARSRKVWKSFDEDVQRHLVESILIPYVVAVGDSKTIAEPAVSVSSRSFAGTMVTSAQAPHLDPGKCGSVSQPFYSLPGSGQVYHSGRFPEGTFLICNHGDELTAWTPLLASLNQCLFLAIPCCSFNLAGWCYLRAFPTLRRFFSSLFYFFLR
ncbi:tRNA(Ser) Um(44) 2'-O-methyltransferase, variant 2 [Orbilia brochopaga]|uniref:tRNA (uracil-O(2)-)-methyltransferase n=1 Tax=Orbilia brochopaga TaxID=3140254 RepID=A0AAV9UZV5_9PEZI